MDEMRFRLGHQKGERDEVAPFFSYDDLADTLMVYFYGKPEPAISVPVEGSPYFYLRVDPESGEILGLQIEAFATKFIQEHPEFVDFIDTLDIPERAFEAIDRSDVRRRRPWAVANMMLGSMMADRELAPS